MVDVLCLVVLIVYGNAYVIFTYCHGDVELYGGFDHGGQGDWDIVIRAGHQDMPPVVHGTVGLHMLSKSI